MVVRDIHILLEHHEAERICNAPGDGEHLHDQENQHRTCVLCHFSFSEYLDINHPAEAIPAFLPYHQRTVTAIATPPAAYTPSAQQRGPPSLLFPSL